MRIYLALALGSLSTLATAGISVEGKDIAALKIEMEMGRATSEGIVKAYLNRIAQIDDTGPRINAVLAVMPDALAQARQRDAERKSAKPRPSLQGIPILIKDNIETLGPVATTAGSFALERNVTNRDAPLVAKLRASGAVILGKSNLSEWANIRSGNSSSGWSAVGGLTRNPHVLNRTACGSSSGSGAAVAASLAAAAIGTETDGSITCPAGANGIVGFKPTLGLVSRTHIVPISHSQDTPGPMARTVYDAALVLTAIAGSDPADPATAEADARKTDFTAGLSAKSLKGVRIGVMRDRLGDNPEILALFETAVRTMAKAGAEIVEIKDTRSGLDGLGEAEFAVLMFELKADLKAYLESTPKTVKSRNLGDLIAFNKSNAARELQWFGQDEFETANAKGDLDDPAYISALARSKKMAGPDGIDRLLRDNKVDVLLGITNGPAWTVDLVNGDHFVGPGSSQLPAVAGYPHLTVPMGAVHGLPIGISFIGTKWDDAHILAYGYAYEQASQARVLPKYLPSLETSVR
jgi:amidase